MIFISSNVKNNPQKRWDLPDEVFFAAGACHILAYVFLELYEDSKKYKPVWIKPKDGFKGNHIFVTNEESIFDYSGFSNYKDYLENIEKNMKKKFPNWNYELIPLQKDDLVSRKKSERYKGLYLREPQEFLYNALPRAKAFLETLI